MVKSGTIFHIQLTFGLFFKSLGCPYMRASAAGLPPLQEHTLCPNTNIMLNTTWERGGPAQAGTHDSQMRASAAGLPPLGEHTYCQFK